MLISRFDELHLYIEDELDMSFIFYWCLGFVVSDNVLEFGFVVALRGLVVLWFHVWVSTSDEWLL